MVSTEIKYGYTTKYRPICIGITCPRDGWIVEKTDPATRTPATPFGITYYERELTPEELKQWEMVRVN